MYLMVAKSNLVVSKMEEVVPYGGRNKSLIESGGFEFVMCLSLINFGLHPLIVISVSTVDAHHRTDLTAQIWMNNPDNTISTGQF